MITRYYKLPTMYKIIGLLDSGVSFILPVLKLCTMRYILVIELESIGFTSCKVQGLLTEEISRLENVVKGLGWPSNRQIETFYEVDTQGIKLLNILAFHLSYRVCSQSMVIENSVIGGRTIQVQKTVWTLINA